MSTDVENPEVKENSELKEKATEAFKAGVAAAKVLGGIACDLGKKGYSAARDKAKELGEKVKEANRKAQEEETERRRMYAEQMVEALQRSEENRRERKYCGDPKDKCFLMSYGWLFAIWWIMNFIDTVLCLWWFISATDSSYTRGTAWIALVVLVLALVFNRLAYEGAVAFFEMVRHLRQIRDELHWHNMREDEKWNGRRMSEDPDGTKAQSAAQDAPGRGDGTHADEHVAETTH